jgi:Transposase IS116/IS110/IS902 family
LVKRASASSVGGTSRPALPAAQGREGTKVLLAITADDGDERLPVDARASLIVLAAQLQALQTLVGSIEKRIIAQHRASEASKRLASIPGIGVLGASAITATATDPNAFQSGRDFAAWVKALVVPSNVSLVPLPPRVPELNGQENIWQFMRQNWLSNRIFKSFDDIVDHCCYAWNTLINQPWKIMSIARRDWAAVGHPT